MAIVSIYAGSYKYKKWRVEFWLTPKTLKALIWEPNSLILIKKFWVRSNSCGYVRLKERVIKYLDNYGDNSAISGVFT